jgi:ribose transport system permease protein
MTWARGLGLALTDQASVIVDAGFVQFVNTRLAGVLSVPLLAVVVCYVTGDMLLRKSRVGRYTFAIGGDETAAQESGVRVSKYKFLVFVLSGIYVGIATVLTVGRQGAATPNAVFGLELDAIVAVIVGGSKLTGGEGSVRRTLVGVAFLSILNNGLSTLGMRDAYFFLFKGAVILLALALDAIEFRGKRPQVDSSSKTA